MDINSPINRTVYIVVRRLARLLIGRKMPFNTFVAVCRRAWVDTAIEDFKLPSRRQTDSRVALLTGMSRTQISRITLSDFSTKGVPLAGQGDISRLLSVLRAWCNDPQYSGAKGPKAIPVRGDHSFESICLSLGRGVGYKPILEELLNTGNIEYVDEETIRCPKTSITFNTPDHMLITYALSVASLMDSAHHNIHKDAGQPPFFQQLYWSRFIPGVEVDVLRKKLRKALNSALKESKVLIDETENLYDNHDGKIVGVGISYFDNDHDSLALEKKT